MVETDKITQKLPNQEFDYFKIGKILLSRWYWIALAVILCMAAAQTYLWYTPQTFATSAKMKFEEKKSDISDLVNVMGADKGASKIQSEMFVLQSRNLILKAVKSLHYDVSLYVEGKARTREVYPNKNLDIKILKLDSIDHYDQLITYKPINATTFNLSYKLDGATVNANYGYNRKVTIGNTIFSISTPANAKFLFKFNTPNEIVGRVQSGLSLGEVVKNSNIIQLGQIDSDPRFAAAALNAIMKEYLIYDREHKQQSASQIISFIDTQLHEVTDKVNSSEKTIDNFKTSSQILDVASSAQMEASKANTIEAQRDNLKIQLSAIQEFQKQVNKGADNITLNFPLEGGNELMNTLLANLTSLFADRAYYLKTYTANSQFIASIDKQIAQVKNDIKANTDLAISSTQRKINALNGQLDLLNQKIATFPNAERELGKLNRDFEINQKGYNFLAEKKQDAQISRSSILPGATIVEPAQVNMAPVSPNEQQIHRMGIVVGLLIGIGLIVLIRILNPYIYDKETIESLTTTPIIGVIRKFPQKLDENSSEILVLSQPKSVFAESVRSVRTNLSFLAAEKLQKVICITSEVSGEGKSFVSVNLASTLSLIDKKIVLIAADLRRSKLHKTFHVPNDVGLSNFLANQNTIEDIIIPTNQSNLDFIPSGPVPPNPSELLHTDRMTYLIDVLKRTYDIVMIDTAPVGLVSDSIPLIRASDINVFVIRSGKSKFFAATIPQRISSEYALNNSFIVLNAFEEDLLHSRFYTTKFAGDSHNGGYYYSDYIGYEGSGYYIDVDKKKWWDVRNWFRS